MYKKGELEIGKETDCRAENYDDVYGCFLPHSCSQWVIGGPNEIRDLMNDLQVALYKLEWEPKQK